MNIVEFVTNTVRRALKKFHEDHPSGDVLVAEYNVTTAQELLAYLGKASFAPIIVKRGSDYYTAVLANQRNSESALVRVLGSSSGDYYLFNYVVTGNTWASSSYGLQKRLVSGTDIKTFNGQSLLGSGDIPIPSYVGSGWGVAKTGSVEGNTSMTPITVDISDLGLSSINDYQVAVSVSGMESYVNHNAIVAKISKNAFTILTGPAEPSTFIVNYTVIAKGYGGVPNGGTTDQVLAKKSGADGDTEWRDVRILESPNGTKYKLIVLNDGSLSTEAV